MNSYNLLPLLCPILHTLLSSLTLFLLLLLLLLLNLILQLPNLIRLGSCRIDLSHLSIKLCKVVITFDEK